MLSAGRTSFLNILGILFALFALLAGGVSCRRGGDDLLLGVAPSRVVGIPNAAVITDGRVPAAGDGWNVPGAAVFDGDGALAEYDLGREVLIRGAALQGDNNDSYILAISDDGRIFRDLWVAPAVSEPGLRERRASGLDARARYVRLSARGGDGHYSVSELQLSSEGSVGLPAPEVGGAGVRTAFIYLVIAFGLVLFGGSAFGGRAGPLVRALVWLILAAAVVWTVAAVVANWPLPGQDLSFIRSVAAAIALLALVRLRPKAKAPAHRPTVVAACAVAAVLAFACFYNLGRPQHWHGGAGRPTFVHLLDMRIYQPFAKYFPELRYDGVYLAQILAYAEDERGGGLASLDSVEIRDQRDHQMRVVGDLHEPIRAVRARFTDARWADFKRDMVFFRSAMGASFPLTLTDHGANATPVWVGLARLFLGHTVASESTLTLAGLVDGALFLGVAVAIALSFGVVPMLVAMTLFGANELYMFGSNWGGATLRHDWLALIAFSVCALKSRRWVLGGALIGLGTMLRVVPAVGIVGVALPVLGAGATLAWRRVRGSTSPGANGLRAFLHDHRDALRVLVAAAATMVLSFLLSGFLYSFESWAQWWRKIVMVNADPAVNEVSLRALLAGGDPGQRQLLHARWALYLGAQVASFLVVLRAARGRQPDQAMLLGLPLMLVLMHPVNYHDHFIFLLPLVIIGVSARAHRAGELLASAAPLLVMGVAGYQISLDADAGRRFQTMTVALFAALGWFYANVLRGGPESSAPSADSTASGASS